jgi:CYTH domain-containing protein
MATEIERKFLVEGDSWREHAMGTDIRQGYLCAEPERSVRIRRAGDQAWLTIKGATEGISRLEHEYPIPAEDADELLEICLPGKISKTRYRVNVGSHLWEIDEFYGDNAGLLVAEIELTSPDESFEKPGWLGKEVSDDARYYNASLIRHPYCRWKADA